MSGRDGRIINASIAAIFCLTLSCPEEESRASYKPDTTTTFHLTPLLLQLSFSLSLTHWSSTLTIPHPFPPITTSKMVRNACLLRDYLIIRSPSDSTAKTLHKGLRRPNPFNLTHFYLLSSELHVPGTLDETYPPGTGRGSCI